MANVTSMTRDCTATAVPSPYAVFWKTLWTGLLAALRKIHVQKKPHTLRIEETLPLGEHRFLAVVQWRNEKLLLGVTPQTISLLEPPHRTESHGLSREEERGA